MRLADILGRGTVKLPPDDYPVKPGSRTAAAHALLSDYLAEQDWTIYPDETESGRAVLALDRPNQVCVVNAIIERLSFLGDRTAHSHFEDSLHNLLQAVLGRRLPLQQEDAFSLVDFALISTRANWYWRCIATTIGRYVAEYGIDEGLRTRLERWAVIPRHPDADELKRVERVRAILGEVPPLLIAGDPWSDAVLLDVGEMPPEQREALLPLLAHARKASAAHPGKAWITTGHKLLESLDAHQPFERIATWIQAFISCRPDSLIDANSDVLRGLAWFMRLAPDARYSHLIADAAETAYRKITGVGAACAKVGNACVTTLGSLPGLDPVMQLERLRRRVKNRVAQSLIEEAFQAAARKAGLTPDELAEIAAPACGMDDVGHRREEVGDFVAELTLGPSKPVWQWSTREGKALKAVPAAVKNDFAEDWKAMKAAADEIGKMLPVQRDRLERFFLAERRWDFATWRARYLDHPLVGYLARRLIWLFESADRSGLAIWHTGALTDVECAPLDWLSDDATVQLWHPIASPPETVLGWRTFLEDNRITQPFKQAHREIYVLTDAEVQTDTYSNRFAAHILKQHQFSALCLQRGWRYQLQGAFDSPDQTATLYLPGWGVSAEFWTERPWEDAERQDGLSEAGIFLNVITDQVRFVDIHRQPRPLSEIPALIFSEVMRDVDLFVGVSSVGNDPSWQDRGDLPAGQYMYWNNYSFGELAASAESRRDVLSRLLPRLKIASCCRLTDRFLIVTGDLRTYKIHLGSSNIMMEPNDQYLCIVAGRSSAAKEESVFLPFEGDRTLSLILSKAFLLAEDRKITDPTIVRQICPPAKI